MRIVVGEADEAHDGRPDIRVIAEDPVEAAKVLDAGPGHAEPGAGDLILEIAMIPSEARFFDKAARGIARRRAKRRGLARGAEEVIVIAEDDEIRRTIRI